MNIIPQNAYGKSEVMTMDSYSLASNSFMQKNVKLFGNFIKKSVSYGLNHESNPRTMNVFIPKLKKVFGLVIFLLPFLLNAQSGTIWQTYNILPGTQKSFAPPGKAISNNNFDKKYVTYTGGKYLTKHGQIVSLAPCYTGTCEITYQPNAGFVGKDTVIVTYSVIIPQPRQVTVGVVFNMQTRVKAGDDYGATLKNQKIKINVIANDLTEGGSFLELRGISLASNCTAKVVSGTEIEITPAKDFEGVAYANYTVCDDMGACANGSVAVNVSGIPLPENLTISLVTGKNSPTSVLMPANGYTSALLPANGTIKQVGSNVYQYTPNTDFYGKDQMKLELKQAAYTSKITVNIDVLNKKDANKFAIEDNVSTPKDTPVTIDALANDVGAGISIASNTASADGTLFQNGSGKFIFTPKKGFEGVTRFSYTINVPAAANNGKATTETAYVYVTVSNLAPTLDIFDLTTPLNTPLVLNYNIPITGYNFNIVSNGDHGGIVFYPTANSLQIGGGQAISGSNLLIYTPNKNYVGKDEIEIDYNINGIHKTVKLRVNVIKVANVPPPYCVQNCVWAGDANYDGVVNMEDLLPLGLTMGESGISRPYASLNWYGQYGEDWDKAYSLSAINLKHIDMDGDGEVGVADTLAISKSYGKYHNLVAAKPKYLKDLKLFPVLTTANPKPGDMAVVDLYLGTESNPAYDMLGFTFSFSYGTAVKKGTMKTTFSNSSWFNYGTPTVNMVKEPYTGSVDAGYTRTNKVSASGYGKVGEIRFIVDESVNCCRTEDERNITLRFGGASMINSAGQGFTLSNQDLVIPIQHSAVQAKLDETLLLAYPNPASSTISLHINGGYTIERYNVNTVTGQLLTTQVVNGNDTQIDVSRLPMGMYFVQAITDGGVLTKKIEVIRD